MPTPAATSAPPVAPNANRQRRWHPHVPAWLIRFFAWLWGIIKWLWAVIVVGGLLVDCIKAGITGGFQDAINPSKWALTGQILTHPLRADGVFLVAVLL